MIDLDAVERFSEIDPQGMLGHAINLPQTCAEAWDLAAHTFPQLALPDAYHRVRQIVIAGMGGSAIGGDLLAALVSQACPIPVLVNRSYELPAFVSGPHTLVVGASHSGNTEETLSVMQQARAQGALLLAITTGGELARLCSAWGAPVLRFAYNSQPRAALGYSFIPLLNLLCHLNLIEDQSAALNEAVQVMRDWQVEIGPTSPLSNNPAKRLAGQLIERMPVIYGAGLLAPVARRWKTQFNENSKAWAFYEELPELNHNAVVGYEISERIREWATVILLRSRYDSPRIQARWRVTREMLIREGVGSDQVYARGQSRLAQMLSLVHFGDLVSIYLALATNVNPTPVAPIVYLKEQLTRVP